LQIVTRLDESQNNVGDPAIPSRRTPIDSWR
jgi:hypothetical protein